MTVVRTSYKEKRQIEQKLLECTDPLDLEEPEAREWRDGWDYDSVAKAVASHLNKSHSRYIAKEMGWVISARPKVKPTIEELLRRIEELEIKAQFLDDESVVGRLEAIERIINDRR